MSRYVVYKEDKAFDFYSFDEAVSLAEENNCTEIEDSEGYDTFSKCWFCGEWFTRHELNDNGECFYCEQAIKSHGG